ncbi:MAG: hypothetical protein DMG70_07725 [Acidobacteria bacterium]|nr:MAG: hypothetical protein DMG70_07725 [Acidobacteriota bacterium]PYY08047.1 MAG: hypothetical protein DMG69_16625 [Acidobacteriota bacterium]
MACGECPAWGYVDQPSLIALFHNALPGSSATSLGHRCPPSAYLLLRIIKTGEQRLWLWFAVRYGIGLENKYSMAVFGFAVVVGPLLTEQRRVFASKGIWIGGPIALLIFLPNLIWKLQHNGPLVELMRNIRASGRDIEVGAFGLPRAPDLPGDSGDISGLADGSVLFSFRTRGPRISGLGWAFMAVLATLVVLHGKDYYATPVYPMVFAGDGCGNRRGSADLRSG